MTIATDTLRNELGARILAEQRAARARLQALERNASGGRLGDGDNTPLADPLEAARQAIAEIELEGSRDTLVRRLKKLYRAAEKVREGSYGACDVCGDSIPLARLQAVPEAVHCRDCAEELERTANGIRRDRVRLYADEELAVAA